MIYSAMLIYMAATMITPGPNNLTMLFFGAEYGFRGTRRFLTASTICLFIKTLLCGILNMALASVIPVMVNYLKWIGAAYMLYLGYTMARSGWKESAPGGSDGSGSSGDSDAAGKSAGNISAAQQTESTYRSGVILQLLNMKSWISCLSLYAVYVVPANGSLLTIIWVAVLYTAFMLASSICWGFFGSSMRRFISRYRKPFGIAIGLSLLYCAVTAII